MLAKCSTRFPHGDLLLEGMSDFSVFLKYCETQIL